MPKLENILKRTIAVARTRAPYGRELLISIALALVVFDILALPFGISTLIISDLPDLPTHSLSSNPI